MAKITALLSLGLLASLVPLMTFPAGLPQIAGAWGLSANEAGWIGGIYFAGYAAAVPLLSSAMDRSDGRLIYICCSLVGAAASFAFAALAEGFWLALVLRFLSGVALAGVHMPGLKMLLDRLDGVAQQRAAAIYTSVYALGSAGSFLIAGVLLEAFGWRAAFAISALGPVIAIAVILLLPPVTRVSPPTAPAAQTLPRLGLRELLQNRKLMAYVLGFAGNTWEVFSIRVWFVACVAWQLKLPGNQLDLPPLALLAGLAAMAGVPASIAVAELALKYGRRRLILATCFISVLTCLFLAATAGGPIILVLSLLVFLQITSFADVGALSAGAAAAAAADRRGATLALYAFAGFTTGWLGPVAVGMAIDWFGGLESTAGWTAGFIVMAAGSSLAAWSVRNLQD